MIEKKKLYDLCIVGAGISGLNALFVASKYLDKNSKVLLIDKKNKAGGMWNSCYDHVRLHQPYIFFTVGNISWNIKKKKNYLATKPEIISYLNYCLEKLSKKVNLEVKYDCTFISNYEQEIDNEFIATSTYRTKGDDFQVYSKKLIKTLGNDYSPHEPFPTSSKNVKSIIQEDFPIRISEIIKSKKPIYIIGGGKSGADAADYLIRNCKENKIHLLAGRGTLFEDREEIFPLGLKRYIGGTTFFDSTLKIANKFNGLNAEETIKYLEEGRSLKIAKSAQSSSSGFISKKEISFIQNGLNSIENDHLFDIIDSKEGLTLILKSGKKIYSDKGIWIVNCKENGFEKEKLPEPYLSDKGTCLSINLSSSVIVVNIVSTYFLTHLFYLEKLDKVSLVTVNIHHLYKNHKEAYISIISQQNIYNLITIFKVLPISVILKWPHNFDKWFPIPRQIFNMLKFIFTGKKMMAHYRKSLTAASKKYNLNFGEVKK